MKIETNNKMDVVKVNQNQAAAKGGLKVRSTVKGGGISLNHSQTAAI